MKSERPYYQPGSELANGSTANTVSRSTYQQPSEQGSRHNSSFEHNIPISITKLRWIRSTGERGSPEALTSADLNKPEISENQA